MTQTTRVVGAGKLFDETGETSDMDQRDFFEVQMLKEYRQPYEARLPDLLAEPREVRIWKPLRGHMTVALPDTIHSQTS